MIKHLFTITFFLSIITLLSNCNTKEEVIENRNTLPFGLKYYQNKSQVDSIFQSEIDKGILTNYVDNIYEYNYQQGNQTAKLRIEPFFLRDSLYKIDMREDVLKNNLRDKSFGEQYKVAKTILRNFEIEPTKYKESKDNTFKSYIWSNGILNIQFIGDHSFIIIFSENMLSKELDEKRSKQLRDDLKERQKRKEQGISRITSKCFSAINEDSFDDLTKASVRKDEYKIKQMISTGKVYVLEPSTDVYVIKREFSKTKIRTSEGITLWVANEFISK